MKQNQYDEAEFFANPRHSAFFRVARSSRVGVDILAAHARKNSHLIRHSPISVNFSVSRRIVPALHLFKGAQTETVRLLFDASASARIA